MVRFVIKLSGGQVSAAGANGILFLIGTTMNILAIIIFLQIPPL